MRRLLYPDYESNEVEKMTYAVGDRIAHPLHGAGTIHSIEQRRINGVDRYYYAMRMPVGDMLVMIPTETSDTIGVRPIVSVERCEEILAAIPDLDVQMTANWNKRYRENMVRIKSGDLMEVAAVIKGLMLRDAERALSTGERKMLHSAKQILISEIALSCNASYDEVEERLDACMT